MGGNGATEAQWPSVGLLYNKRYNTKCTVSIISPIWAVAAYSCLVNNQPRLEAQSIADWSLYAGGSHLLNNTNNATVQMRIVKEIIPHPRVIKIL